MNEINKFEKDSILYYQGGGDGIVLDTENQDLREFYNVHNSYLVINALLMPGISNEKARLKEERKSVKLNIFKHMDELLKVYCGIYSAMCKYTYLSKHENKYYTYRADRMNTLEFLKDGKMYSFMSTDKYSNKNKDFHDKDRILLLEVDAPGNIEHIDVNAVLGEKSKYPHEHEILFAPFVCLDKEPLEMTKDEKIYEDMHGNPPEAKYLLHLKKSSIDPCKMNRDEELKKLYQEITSLNSMNNVRQIWESLMMEEIELKEGAVNCYMEWKKKLQKYLKICFAGIKYEVITYLKDGH